MPKLFGVDIAAEVHKAISAGLIPATLTRVIAGERIPGRLSYGTEPTTEEYSCRGFIEDYQDRQIDGTNIRVGDRRVTLIGKSISNGSIVPQVGDKITIDGSTYTIVPNGRNGLVMYTSGIRSDPANAVYVCQVRK